MKSDTVRKIWGTAEGVSRARAAKYEAAWKAAKDWNRRYPVGTLVSLEIDGKQLTGTTTRPARVVLGINAVVWIRGIVGYRLLSQVRPIEEG